VSVESLKKRKNLVLQKILNLYRLFWQSLLLLVPSVSWRCTQNLFEFKKFIFRSSPNSVLQSVCKIMYTAHNDQRYEFTSPIIQLTGYFLFQSPSFDSAGSRGRVDCRDHRAGSYARMLSRWRHSPSVKWETERKPSREMKGDERREEVRRGARARFLATGCQGPRGPRAAPARAASSWVATVTS